MVPRGSRPGVGPFGRLPASVRSWSVAWLGFSSSRGAPPPDVSRSFWILRSGPSSFWLVSSIPRPRRPCPPLTPCSTRSGGPPLQLQFMRHNLPSISPNSFLPTRLQRTGTVRIGASILFEGNASIGNRSSTTSKRTPFVLIGSCVVAIPRLWSGLRPYISTGFGLSPADPASVRTAAFSALRPWRTGWPRRSPTSLRTCISF